LSDELADFSEGSVVAVVVFVLVVVGMLVVVALAVLVGV
jgi:hypothetical protein